MSGSSGSSRVISLAALALGLSFAFFRCSGGASCLRDSDCPSGNVCSAGACTLPPEKAPPSDAGSDARSDAMTDAGPDAGRDAGDSSAGAAGAPSGGGGEGGASAQ